MNDWSDLADPVDDWSDLAEPVAMPAGEAFRRGFGHEMARAYSGVAPFFGAQGKTLALASRARRAAAGESGDRRPEREAAGAEGEGQLEEDKVDEADDDAAEIGRAHV